MIILFFFLFKLRTINNFNNTNSIYDHTNTYRKYKIRNSTKKKERNINKKYKITIKLYIFEKINYFKLDITKYKMEKKSN